MRLAFGLSKSSDKATFEICYQSKKTDKNIKLYESKVVRVFFKILSKFGLEYTKELKIGDKNYLVNKRSYGKFLCRNSDKIRQQLEISKSPQITGIQLVAGGCLLGSPREHLLTSLDIRNNGANVNYNKDMAADGVSNRVEANKKEKRYSSEVLAHTLVNEFLDKDAFVSKESSVFKEPKSTKSKAV